MESLTLAKTGLKISPVGFGGYRVSTEDPAHRKSLRKALLSGCRLIDTSANYMDGGSERLVGEVLGELVSGGELKRDDVVVVTKAGYVQGGNLEHARARESEGRPFPEMVKYGQGIWHCLSPEFLDDQITRSLERLKLPYVDALLLHNPEYFLKHRLKEEVALETARDEYYDRIRRAFEHLEKEVERGRIRWYGVSSNSFGESADSQEFTSFDRVHEAAVAAATGKESKFGLIQFPLNLLERGGALARNHSRGTVMDAARDANVGVLINRPLNGFNGQRMTRLASFGEFPVGTTESSLREAASVAIARAREVEDSAPKGVPVEKMAWARSLEESFHQVNDLLSWQDVLGWRILPSLEAFAGPLAGHTDAAVQQWFGSYEQATIGMLNAITRWLEFKADEVSRRISGQLDELAPPLTTSKTLSSKCIRLYRSLPGVHCVLVGMRRPDYVDDAMGAGPPIDGDLALEVFRRLEADWS